MIEHGVSGLIVPPGNVALLSGALRRVLTDDGLHARLADASVHPFASTGVTDGRGGFGYIVYVREDEYDVAAEALGVATLAAV